MSGSGTSRFHGLRWVRIMAVYGSDGVWQMDGTEGVLDDLPVPRSLRDRLDAWQTIYDAHDEMDEDAPRLDVPAFAAEGRAIARAVKAALPDWTVVYHDEAASRAGRPRHEVETEISTRSP